LGERGGGRSFLRRKTGFAKQRLERGRTAQVQRSLWPSQRDTNVIGALTLGARQGARTDGGADEQDKNGKLTHGTGFSRYPGQYPPPVAPPFSVGYDCVLRNRRVAM
jgi:hypothetical protein